MTRFVSGEVVPSRNAGDVGGRQMRAPLTRNRRFSLLRSYLAHSAQAFVPLHFLRLVASS